jgi:hypothetical protein
LPDSFEGNVLFGEIYLMQVPFIWQLLHKIIMISTTAYRLVIDKALNENIFNISYKIVLFVVLPHFIKKLTKQISLTFDHLPTVLSKKSAQTSAPKTVLA